MKRRIRSIFWLMTICILGINAFQGYWLFTTYQLNRQQFRRTVQDAMWQAVQQQRLTDARVLLGHAPPTKGIHSKLFIRRFEEAGESERVFISQELDTLPARFQVLRDSSRRVVVSYRKQPSTRNAPNVPADSLAKRISNLLLLDWAKDAGVDLRTFAATYRSELTQRGIDADFRLDTLTIRPKRARDNVFIFKDLTAVSEKTDLCTTPIPINPVKNLFVQASFTTPTFYLLRRMGWLLGSSVLLLALTTGCFLFMLSTILRQKKLSDVKNDFINNMTHELKTPLATVTAAVEALQHFGALNDPQKTQTYLTVSRDNLQRLSDLVEKVLNLAVEEKKELVLNPEWIRPSELVNQIIGNHQVKADKPVHFEVDIQPGEEPVRIDRFHTTNAINNLIDNAIKYSKESVTIRITSGKQERVWRLSVQDNGIGIPKSYHQAIFDRFFRVPTGNLHPVKGFGLGLSYVRQVIEKHGGLIDVISEPGVGSEFVLLIPETGGDGQARVRKFSFPLFRTPSPA
ncbi:two-component system sensor histidine kinase [Fibrisoma limi BUZ 3]|uniref:histidine kinase n=1 Tax=Fibrisoma limi BUZ 3 TaxID=1185876 RepID=I2GF80_9BACT|nr:HAMP domain-containing sensor histidine kinase [Fibrisoma limi]CCH52555.1 two-component system sensor histidine kinase [Fibrisoma limi BUZ 3]